MAGESVPNNGQSWNDTSLPWQSTSLPWKDQNLAWNNTSLPWKAGGTDPLAPAAPSTPDLQAASDSGSSSTDNITNDNTPTFDIVVPSGYGDARDAQDTDDLVQQISDTPTFTGTPTSIDGGDISGGTVSYTPTALSDGTYYTRARIERTGHNGPWSGTLTFVIDTTAPTVSSVAFSSAAGGSNNYFVAGNNIDVTVTFSESVLVNTGGGTPSVTVLVGASNKTAAYISGSGTTALLFRYTVQTGDADTDGISISANTLALNSGTIKDAAGNNATITHSAVTTDATRKVDAVAPAFTSSTSTSVTSNVALAYSVVTDESTTKAITGGADQAQFELVTGSTPSAGHTLRWLSNGTRDSSSPQDFGADNGYVVQITATDLASNQSSPQTVTVTVTSAVTERDISMGSALNAGYIISLGARDYSVPGAYVVEI